MTMFSRSAFTLLELISVLCILVALSGLLIPLCADQINHASQTATRATLVGVEQAIIQYWQDTKHVVLDGSSTFATEAQRFELVWLFRNPVTNDSTVQFDPNTGQGWNGPYLVKSTSGTGTLGVVDAWNRTLAVQYINPNDSLKDVRFVSAGLNGVLEIPTIATSQLSDEDIGDDVYVALMLR
jgi:type II secretory pathway pseudopilin PulG